MFKTRLDSIIVNRYDGILDDVSGEIYTRDILREIKMLRNVVI